MVKLKDCVVFIMFYIIFMLQQARIALANWQMFVHACGLMRYKGDDDFMYAGSCNISNIPNNSQKNYIHPYRQKFPKHSDLTEKFK